MFDTSQTQIGHSDFPHLSDEAAVAVLNFLHEFVFRFEAQYSGQIHRFYDQQTQEAQQLSKTVTTAQCADPPF